MRESTSNPVEVLPVGESGAVLVLSELESMAGRQQREIAQQRRLLEQKEVRLAVLRGIQEPAQQDKLARLRHRLDQQQSKLNRLRMIKSQTDQSRANNATLTSDLDCIRALFNEKEKELSLAVAKVEELTRQLEELRGRQNVAGPRSGIGGIGAAGGKNAGSPSNQLQPPASVELEKLRRELMYRNKMNEQQNQVVSQQRLALAQRQAEMASIDARIAQLQGRLQRKRALNQRLSQQLDSANRASVNPSFTDTKFDFSGNGKSKPTGNIAAIEPYSHIPNDSDFNLNKNDPKYQTLPYNTKFTVNFKTVEEDLNSNKNKIQHSASASQIGQRSTFQQFGNPIVHSQSQQHIQGQSQSFGTNLQQLNQNATSQLTNNVNNFSNSAINNNNNNNINNANNINNSHVTASYGVGFENSSQNNKIHNLQQQPPTQQQLSNMQQKSQNSINPSTSNLGSANFSSPSQRNLQVHQKPISSVAPSFSVKSPIYQTSSTKIHPVMPQTLSLVARGQSNNHNSIGTTNMSQSQSNQLSVTSVTNSNQETNYISRHNYSGIQQHGSQTGVHVPPIAVYQTQNLTNVLQNNNLVQSNNNNFTNCTVASRYNQIHPLSGTSSSMDQQNDKIQKYEISKNSDKFEQVLRYDSNMHKYDTQMSKFDQTDQKPYEQSSANEQSVFQLNLNKYEQALEVHENNQLSHEQNMITKFDGTQNNLLYRSHDQHHDIRSHAKYEHNTAFKNDESNQQLRQDIVKEGNHNKLDQRLSQYEQNTNLKHEQNTKFDVLKLYDNEKLQNESRDDKSKRTLSSKPVKPNPPPRLTHHEKPDIPVESNNEHKLIGNAPRINKEDDIPPIPTSEPPESPTGTQYSSHPIIKPRPLALKKTSNSDPPVLRYAKSNVHVSINRRIEMPPAFLFPENEIPADLMQTDLQQQQTNESAEDENSKKNLKEMNENVKSVDIVDSIISLNLDEKSKFKDISERRIDVDIDGKSVDMIRRKKGNLKSTTSKANLSRRVSFDPLALLLDASLEGELELVKKTAKEVPNPSSANDEGITALHNAICAGHLDIVKFLVEFGCDVNAQDSDGWTPLHCAASCNNLSMVKFLVEHGACIFATTLSDHETAAEKCEEDEEGFDGCSEYLYSVQEKLGIMNNGQVYAVFDYEAQHSDELSLLNGDALIVLRKGDDNEREWWWSKLDNKEGYVPRNLLGLYPRVQPTKTD